MSIVWSVGRLRLIASTLLHRRGKLPSNLPVAKHAGTYLYREQTGKEPLVLHYMGEVLSFFMWYWILYHCWYEYDHLVPSSRFPDPSKYTDEELGIPPDSED